MKMIRTLSGLCCAVALAASAHADIRAFNAAVVKADYKTAAAEAASTWPGLDKARPDIGAIAREFGIASYMAGEYQAAKTFGDFIASSGAKDDLPATTAVMLRGAEYRLANNPKSPARDALLAALKARVTAKTDADNVSIIAAENFYVTQWKAAEWGRARDGAQAAAELLGRGGPGLAERALEARMAAAAADFIKEKNFKDYAALADAHDAAVALIDAQTDPARRKAMLPLMFQLQAWTEAVNSYFVTANNLSSQAPRVKDRKLADPAVPIFEGAETPDACKGDLDEGKLSYPSMADFQGLVGAVLVRVDFDSSGKSIGHEVLAAVPSATFAPAVEKAAPSFTLKRRKDDTATCRLDSRNRIISIRFVIR